MPFIILIAAFFILLSNQPVLMACAFLSYIIVGRNFWKDGEPKTIFFGLTFFWLSISIKLFYAIYANVTYESLSKSPNIIHTTYVSLAGFLAFAYGMHVTTKKTREKNTINFKEDFGYNPTRVVWVFVGSSAAVLILKGFGFFITGLDQLVYALIDMKIGFIFLLLYFTFTKRISVLVVASLLTMEVIFSFFSFFASFKDILFTVLIVLASPKIKLTLKNIATFSTLIFFTFFLLLKWQAVKSEYRVFLNKGSTESQNVEVTQSEALDKLQELSEKKNKCYRRQIADI